MDYLIDCQEVMSRLGKTGSIAGIRGGTHWRSAVSMASFAHGSSTCLAAFATLCKRRFCVFTVHGRVVSCKRYVDKFSLLHVQGSLDGIDRSGSNVSS
jgi:hypothetical protein